MLTRQKGRRLINVASAWFVVERNVGSPVGARYTFTFPSKMTVITSFSVYLVSVVKRPPADLADQVTSLLLRLRDELNGGHWGTFAEAILDPSLPDDLRAFPPVDPLTLPGDVADQARRGFSDEEMARIRAHLAQGELRVLTASLDGLSFKYHRVQPDYHLVQLRFADLFDGERRGDAGRFAAVLDVLESPLPRRVFADLDAHFGFIGVVPGENMPPQLFAWPPSGHWRDHLSAELVSALGGVAKIRSLLPEHLVAPGPTGAVDILLPLPPDQADSPEAERLKGHFSAVMAASLPRTM